MEKISDARRVFNLAKGAWDDWGVPYVEEGLSLTGAINADGERIAAYICVNEELQTVGFCAYAPLTVPEKLRKAVAVAIALLNLKIFDGAFVLDYLEGTLLFYSSAYFKGCELTEAFVNRKLTGACATMAKYAGAFKTICEKELDANGAVKLVTEIG